MTNLTTLLQPFNVVASGLTRPWGGFTSLTKRKRNCFRTPFFEGLDVSTLTIGGKLSLKILLVSPAQRLSWQYHNRRAEIWRVLEGPGSVVRSHTDEEGELVVHQVGYAFIPENQADYFAKIDAIKTASFDYSRLLEDFDRTNLAKEMLHFISVR
jgi:mannose-6-phosphate isomerase-like protein (cupin superfamily)